MFVALSAAWGLHADDSASSFPGKLLVSASAVPMGSYQRFGVWEGIQLGATSLINPKAAQSAAVVYAFEPEFLGEDASVKRMFLSKLRAGEVGYAIKAGRSYHGYVVITRERQAEIAKKIAKALANQSTKQHILPVGKFLSYENEIAGVTSSEKWIAWDAEKPIEKVTNDDKQKNTPRKGFSKSKDG